MSFLLTCPYSFVCRTVVALKGKDGVVLAVEKIVTSKLYEPGTNKRIFPIDRHVSAAVAGLLADSRSIVEKARDEASDYRSQYGMPIPINVSESLSLLLLLHHHHHLTGVSASQQQFHLTFIVSSFSI